MLYVFDLQLIKYILKEWYFGISSDKPKKGISENENILVSLSSAALWQLFLRFHTHWFSSSSTVKTPKKQSEIKEKTNTPYAQKRLINT